MTEQRSPLARQVPGVRDPKLGYIRSPWGFLIHTTGGGITELAKKKKRRPIDVAIETYIESQNGSNGYKWGGPGYVLDHDGTIYQLAPDDVLTNHCGGANRPEYLAGTWINKAAPAAVAQWFAHWGPRYKHPYQLFPSKSPNTDYIGLEMIPCGDGFGEPMRSGLRFSRQQHDAVIDLAKELGARHEWPAGWHRTPRFLGHEDVDILNRMDKGGGWDPGNLRAQPYVDFDYLRAHVG